MTIPSYPFITTFIIMTVTLVARYLIGSSLFHLFCKFTDPSPLTSENIPPYKIREDINSSLISSVVFAFFSAILIKLWQHGLTQIYTPLSAFPIWYIPLAFFLYLLLHDTYFYWTHRLLHEAPLRKYHQTHHRSRLPTAWTSFAFHPVEAAIQAFFIPAVVTIIPIHWSALVLYLLIMTLFGLTNHLGHEIYPKWVEERLFLITATHHQKHHLNQGRNFGLFFSGWDRLMGTELKKDVP